MKVIFFSFLMLSTLSVKAEDQVDVIINGKSYSCTDSGSSVGVKSGCSCIAYPESSPKGAGLVYFSTDPISGKTTATNINAWYEGSIDSLVACTEFKKGHPLCQ